MSSKIPVAISFAGVANFLGILGVIGSLVFVGLELRQTQRIALADMEQRRSEQNTDRALAFFQEKLRHMQIRGANCSVSCHRKSVSFGKCIGNGQRKCNKIRFSNIKKDSYPKVSGKLLLRGFFRVGITACRGSYTIKITWKLHSLNI